MKTWLETQLYLTEEQMEKLNTKRLLTYYKKKRHLRRVGVCDCCGEILTKEDKEINDWANAHLDKVKEILDTKEHVEKKDV